ncbi:MAG: arylsulfatase [Verrucomicrobiota bacterium]
MKIRLSILAAFLAGVTFLPAAEKKPNILILYADDLGYGDLTCYNPESKIPTPHLDQLAGGGMRFLDGHSSSGICTPSRYALLTGRYHWRDFHGIVNALGESVFAPERLTLPEMLKEKGYRTAVIGKWHLGWDWASIRKPEARPIGEGRKTSWGPDAFNWDRAIPDGPLAHGFDHYFGDTVINFPPYCWIEDDRVVSPPSLIMDTEVFKPIKEGRWEFRPGPMIEGWDPYENIPETTRRGVEYIAAAAEKEEPFFLYFAYPSPHAPIIPNDEFDGKTTAGPYGDFVYETDDSIGQLLEALEESGLAKDTLVIFTADNGPEKYAYARDENFEHWSAEPLRGLKRDIYEGGHRVPFLIRWPGIVKAGAVSEALVSQIDFMATIASIVGYKLPEDAAEDSYDLTSHLRGEVDRVRESHIHNTFEDRWAMRKGDWVLIQGKDGYHSGRVKEWEEKRSIPADDKAEVELYRLDLDLGQTNNLAGKHPEKVAELQRLLGEIRERGHSAPRLD